ncbi:MAG TPA: hypothetical protein IAB43_04030 [Candidatus Spyradocola merdavium]|nr:hypothetical protein [Candidatus Spyradocola merdavium]
MFKIAAILTSAAMLCTGTLLAAAPEASAACMEPAQAAQRCTVQWHAYIRICGDWWEIPLQPGEELPAQPPEEVEPPAEEAPPQETPPAQEEPDEDAPEESGGVQEAAEAVASLVNAARQDAGLSELELDADLCAAAQARAQEIAQSFSHTRPDGSSCFTILEELGISYRAAGENIAMGQRTPEEVMDGWMNSSGHRANILNGTFTSIGVGYYVDGAGAAHWVQIFRA